LLRTSIVTACFISSVIAHDLFAQGVRPLPYSGQLRTDPSVGNVQGIQRYGRPLKTDPEEGEGFSYHVYPVPPDEGASLVQAAFLANLAARNAVVPALGSMAHMPEQDDKTLQELQEAYESADDGPQKQRAQQALINRKLELLDRQINSLRAQTYASAFVPPPRYAAPYPEPFDATAGLRNYGRLEGAPVDVRDPAATAAMLATKAFDSKTGTLIDIYHQPLIQIKVRVVEVVRDDGLQVQSVLDYISRDKTTAPASLITSNNINNNKQNTSALTRFAQPGLLGINSTGMLTEGGGALINLTAEHINWVASLLASEFNADVLTAPEVVTLNGQNVEFVSGSKVPFELGQNVIQGTNNNIQQFFYKNVGTYISVTPRIVNWGLHGEGEGRRPIVSQEILNWNLLAGWMRDDVKLEFTDAGLHNELSKFAGNKRPLPFDLRKRMLIELNLHDRENLGSAGLFDGIIAKQIANDHPGADGRICPDCDWKAEDCTIDMSLVVRLSELGAVTITAARGGEEPSVEAKPVNTETNVRAVANVIQIKSGSGVVMAGLIGEREANAVSKVPLLGDVPYVGNLFRSKSSVRQKTEVLIFVEAKVLPPDSQIARADSAQDFQLSAPFVEGNVLDNPLEYGLYRVGFGTYLPPHSCSEEFFWERYGRKIRRASTHVGEIAE